MKGTRCHHRGARRRRAAALPYVAVSVVALLAVCSLAVDLGRVRLVKAELQLAADAAARHAVVGIPGGYQAALNRAVDAADDNKADGKAVALHAAEDVEFGTWDPYVRAFTPLQGARRDDATAVRVTARRISARGDAVPLLLARAIGMTTCDATASAVATVAPKQYGIVGLDYIRLWGNSTNSYWSESSSAATGNWGGIASNGDISLGGSSSVSGDARPGPGHTITGGATKVSGESDPLPYPLSYPVESPSPYGPSNNDNSFVPTGARSGPDFQLGSMLSLPGGHYFFRNFRVEGGGVLTFREPAVVYVYGTVNITGRVTTNGNLPKNLRIVTVRDPSTGAAPGAVNIGSNGALYADIYAPLSPLTVGGSSDIYGCVVAKSVDMTGSSQFDYDLSLRNDDGGVRTVQ